MKRIDSLSDSFVNCFFTVQALASIDCCYSKYTERILLFLEFDFFIPFAIIDPNNGGQFAKNVSSFGLQEVLKQSALYVGKKSINLKKCSSSAKAQGCKGTFLICTELPWEQLKAFVNQTIEPWLENFRDVFKVCCFGRMLASERANKPCEHLTPQHSKDECSDWRIISV